MAADDATRPEPGPSLRQLTIFDAVARAGSVGAAARLMALSQPAVTHAMAQLERTLGCRLLDRGQGGSSLTGAGAILHRRATRLRAQLARGIAAARSELAEDAAALPRAAAVTRDKIIQDRITQAQVASHVAVTERGSFRAAARALGISEPALQRTARQLEQLIGVPLYARAATTLTVTPAGRTLATALQLALAEVASARDELAALSGQADGRVAIGCLPLMPKGLLARAIGQLLARFPSVAVSLEESSYDELSAALRQGRLDMLVGALRAEGEGLEARMLFDDPYVAVARRGHPLLSRRRPPGPAELGRLGWVVPPRNTPRRGALESFFNSLPRRPPVVLETNSVAMMIATLVESDCLTLCSVAQARIDFVAVELALIPVAELSTPRPVGVTTRSDWLPTAVQRALLEIIEALSAEVHARKLDAPLA